MHDIPVSELVDVEFTLQLGSGTMRSVLPVPSGEVTLTQLLPILQNFSSGIAQHSAERMAAQGQPVTCRPKCSACCHQLIPISSFEAEGLSHWIRSLQPEQQQALAARFQHALRSLQDKGVFVGPHAQIFDLSPEDFARLGLEYFKAAVPCPFLVEDNCSIYPIRPLVCREYMVVSPPVHCGVLKSPLVQGVLLPVQPSRAMVELGKRVPGGDQGWLPLVFLFHWMATGVSPGASVAGPGPSVLRTFVEVLAGKPESSAAAKQS